MSKQTVNQPATAPAPPPPPAVPGVTTVSTSDLKGGTKFTTRDVGALRARRSELSDQLNSADGRRRSLHEQLRRADGADKAGLEQRLGVLDARIAALESDIGETGQQLSSLEMSRLISSNSFAWTPASGNRFSANTTPIAIIFMIFVLSPMALAFSRRLWRRSSAPSQPLHSLESNQRLERMEQAIDSIAIEVERVSEGQRFVTRILAEGRGNAALGAGQPAAAPVAMPVGERVGANR